MTETCHERDKEQFYRTYRKQVAKDNANAHSYLKAMMHQVPSLEWTISPSVYVDINQFHPLVPNPETPELVIRVVNQDAIEAATELLELKYRPLGVGHDIRVPPE